MNYTQAKLIANSPDCYSVDQWEQAASVLLGRFDIAADDIDDGTVLANRVADHRTAGRYN